MVPHYTAIGSGGRLPVPLATHLTLIPYIKEVHVVLENALVIKFVYKFRDFCLSISTEFLNESNWSNSANISGRKTF